MFQQLWQEMVLFKSIMRSQDERLANSCQQTLMTEGKNGKYSARKIKIRICLDDAMVWKHFPHYWSFVQEYKQFCFDLFCCGYDNRSMWVHVILYSSGLLLWQWGNISSWWTLVQVMACCPTAPSHYLNQCCLLINHMTAPVPVR